MSTGIRILYHSQLEAVKITFIFSENTRNFEPGFLCFDSPPTEISPLPPDRLCSRCNRSMSLRAIVAVLLTCNCETDYRKSTMVNRALSMPILDRELALIIGFA
jgi:hypothetical protein